MFPVRNLWTYVVGGLIPECVWKFVPFFCGYLQVELTYILMLLLRIYISTTNMQFIYKYTDYIIRSKNKYSIMAYIQILTYIFWNIPLITGLIIFGSQYYWLEIKFTNLSENVWQIGSN